MSTKEHYVCSLDTLDWQVAQDFEANFRWEYADGRDKLLNLYRKGKRQQWDSDTRIDWSQDLDPENPSGMPDEMIAIFGSPTWQRMDEKERVRLRHHVQSWQLSQFLHGEQGALVCTAKIVQQVPGIDAKFYAATQVMDEARHVEAFSRLLHEKYELVYPINPYLKSLIEDTLRDSRWDMTYLGMQIMVEGLALAAFGFMHQMTTEPLLKQLLRYVMSDEARHVAFGVLSLQEYYAGLTQAEIRERQEFAYEAAVRMRDRFLQQEVWERMGVPVKEAISVIMATPDQQLFQQMLFAKIVPNCRKLGLIDAGDGWLRERFTELGVIEFEHFEDTGTEYEDFALTDDDVRSA